ncbi:MAG: GAF domain-containing sensor histidine kinase [Truepera sp.]|nr:GAF domain-containing sensor histidine kinase [Truepera sp.]
MTATAPGRPSSLYQQIKRARLWLPLLIVGMVLVNQLVLVPLGGPAWQFWFQLLFYSLLGPLATYLTLNWIAEEVRRREATQNELSRLFRELQASHALLGSIQKVTEQFASASDLDAVLNAAVRGITEVTGARGVAIFLGGSSLGMTRSLGLDSVLLKNAAERDRALLRGEVPGEEVPEGFVLSLPLTWAGRLEGSIHAHFREPPSSEQRESYSILAAEFSAAAEAVQSRTRDLLTLFEVDRSIRAEGNLERMLKTILAQTMARADATLGGVYLVDDNRLLHLAVAQGVGLPPTALLRLGEGFVGRAAERREPCVVRRLSDEDRVVGGGLLAAAGSAISLPLTSEEGLLGVIVLAHQQPAHFDESILPFLNLLAGQVSLAVRNARAYLQSEELAIVEERARIAREIHDGVAQSLAFIALKLDLITRLLESNQDKARAELSQAKATIRETIKEVRRSIFALRPIDLERYGFVETIRRYCHDYGQQNDIRVHVDVKATPQLSPKSEAVLFRIFQEAMNNVAKHAQARQVWVTVGRSESGQSFVCVEDNGRGFDPAVVSDRVTTAGGLGLRQMRERLQGRGGRFELRSARDEGTRIYASMPE